MSDSTSLTWAVHLRTLFIMYNLPDPLLLLESSLWPKQTFRNHTITAITAYHERKLRNKAVNSYKTQFLNVQVIGLTGRPHPVLTWVLTTQDFVRSRVHVKMLAGDYLCYEHLARDRGTDPQRRLCQCHCSHLAPAEDMVHLLTRCWGTAEPRSRILPDLFNTIAQFFSANKLLEVHTHTVLTQFILDPTSLNLPGDIRLAPDYTILGEVVRLCSNLCFAIHKERIRKLKNLGHL